MDISASDTGVGAVFSQQHNEKRIPVPFSLIVSPLQSRTGIGSFNAVIKEALKEWRYWLKGHL